MIYISSFELSILLDFPTLVELLEGCFDPPTPTQDAVRCLVCVSRIASFHMGLEKYDMIGYDVFMHKT